MAVKQKINGKYVVDVRDEYGKRIEKTFNKKTDAKAFEASITKTKYEKHLIYNGMLDQRFFIVSELQDYELTKMNLRPSSIKKYKFVLKQFGIFCNKLGINYLDEFTTDHATILFRELIKEKIDPKGSTERILKPKPKTVNFFLTTIKAFFQYCLIKDHIKRNPMLHIKNIKVEKRKPEYFSVEELKMFFEQPMDKAYYYAFMGLLFTGMRFSELANLTWDDIDFDKKLIHVRSKNEFKTKTRNGERAIPMNIDLNKMLNKMFENKLDNGYVFLSPQGCQLKEKRMLEKCKMIAAKANISSRAFLHKFRHTYATMLILNGVPIQNIKELLGHWSVTETEIYAHNNSNHLHPDVSRLDKLLEN